MTRKQFTPLMHLFLKIMAVLLVVSATIAANAEETAVHRFVGRMDGSKPQAGLISDSAGNLYGTTFYGGTGNCNDGNEFFGCGTVFMFSPNSKGGWTETVLYSFQDSPDGAGPRGSLIRDNAGNLYGTTGGGGSATCGLGGCGTVFELTPPKRNGGSWTETVLYNFQGGADGLDPLSGLILDQNGVLYGTTIWGGILTGSCLSFAEGCGTIFQLKPSNTGGTWTHTVLYRFQPNHDGQQPHAGLVMDSAGNLYGTTYSGGYYSDYCGSGCGTVFKLQQQKDGSWSESVLLAFEGTDGGVPLGTLIFDHNANLYGTTSVGLDEDKNGVFNGSIFRLSPPSKKGRKWNESVLYRCPADSGPGAPWAGVIRDDAGDLYGTTVAGGSTIYGAVFELVPPTKKGGKWTETTLHKFRGGNDGMYPEAGLVFGPGPQVYGTTYAGADSKCSPEGYDTCGMVFAVAYP